MPLQKISARSRHRTSTRIVITKVHGPCPEILPYYIRNWEQWYFDGGETPQRYPCSVKDCETLHSVETPVSVIVVDQYAFLQSLKKHTDRAAVKNQSGANKLFLCPLCKHCAKIRRCHIALKEAAYIVCMADK